MAHLTLTEVKTKFAAWRKKKQHRDPIPEELWDAAVSLARTYSICKISKALGLCYTTLKKRSGTNQLHQPTPPAVSPEFIAVDLSAVSPAECCVEMKHHNGNRLRMHLKGKAELDLQSIADSFWNKNS